MTISVGDSLPEATLQIIGENGPEAVSLKDKTAGRNVVIFALPGAFTGTCTASHVPSFLRTKDDFAAKGVDEIICISVNDPFVMQAWANSMDASGLTFLADGNAEFTKAMGQNFSAAPVGFVDRSTRYALYAENGVVKNLQLDENPGTCDLSGGESLLAAI